MSLILLILFSEPSLANESLHIIVTGVTGDVLQNIQNSLTVEQKRYNKQEPTVDNRQRFYQDASNIIQQAVKPYGYFHAKVQSNLSYEANEWTADFHVIPGPLLHVTGLDIKVTGPGQLNPEIQKFIHHFPMKEGDVLLTKSYEDAKIAFFQVVNDQGYVKAILIKKELRIDLARNTAVIILHMDTGPRYYFGALNFSDSPFATSFLNRFAEFHPGDPFSPQKVLKFQQDLESSHYFREASVTPDFNAAENSQIPTQVKLTAYKAKQYKLGVGYGTFTGPRLLAGVDWRHIGDSGQHFTALAKFSPVLRGLAVKYFIPGTKPLTDQYTLGANIQE
ncbi:MAG TPA: POTRA domain-containing protein, partial [Cyclobacteriaceae bacterium]|nr:POTRA domain-containing protein [Cyclobacteriaceae bacterium]